MSAIADEDFELLREAARRLSENERACILWEAPNPPNALLHFLMKRRPGQSWCLLRVGLWGNRETFIERYDWPGSQNDTPGLESSEQTEDPELAWWSAEAERQRSIAREISLRIEKIEDAATKLEGELAVARAARATAIVNWDRRRNFIAGNEKTSGATQEPPCV